MMEILVTGGAGYIGSQVIKELNKQGYRTVAYDNLVHGHRESVKWGEFVRGDLADIAGLRGVFRQYRFGAVMHFAAYIAAGESVTNPNKYYQNNVINTLNLFQVMLEAGVDKLIFSSTAAVYGEPQALPLEETHPLAPVNPYGTSKTIVEQMLPDYSRAHGLKYISFRYFNASGADPDSGLGERHDPETHLIPLVFDAALGRMGAIKVFGSDYDTPDGTCIRDYIHVADLAQAHVLGLEKLLSGAPGDIFNLGNGEGYSVMQVIDTVKRVTGMDVPVVLAPRREGDTSRLVAGSRKARRLLGWNPQYPALEDIIETVWQWEKNRKRD